MINQLELIRQRLALQVVGAKVNVLTAQQSAQKLQPHLPTPDLRAWIAPPETGNYPPALLSNHQPQIQIWPRAFFEMNPRLPAADLPPEWVPFFLMWVATHVRWQEFDQCRTALEQCSPLPDFLPVQDALVAALLLVHFSPPPDSPLRNHLFQKALTEPLGAYLVSCGHHLPEELTEIVTAVKDDSQLRYWLSQFPKAGELTLNHLKFDLWSALAQLQLHPPDLKTWLEQLVVQGSVNPDAAVAALVLWPDAPEQTLWLQTIQKSDARHAFEAVWWSRHTLPLAQWGPLKKTLRAKATAQGCYWFNWFQIEPEWQTRHYVDPLWHLERICQCYLHREPFPDKPLRRQMVERLVNQHGDPMATLVLKFIDQLRGQKI